MDELLLYVGGAWLLGKLLGGRAGSPPSPPAAEEPPGGGLRPLVRGVVPKDAYALAPVEFGPGELVGPEVVRARDLFPMPEPEPERSAAEVVAENSRRQVRIRETMRSRYGLPTSGSLRASALRYAGDGSSQGVPSIHLLWWWSARLFERLLQERPVGLLRGAEVAHCRRGTWLGWSLVPQVYAFLRTAVPRDLDPAFRPPPACEEGVLWAERGPDGRLEARPCTDYRFGPFGARGVLEEAPVVQYQRGFTPRDEPVLSSVPPATAFAWAALVEVLDGGWDATGTVPVFEYGPACLPAGDELRCCPERSTTQDIRPALLPSTPPEFRPAR